MSITEQPWLLYAPDLLIELEQCRDEGRDITGLEERIIAIQSIPAGDPRRETEAAQLLDETIHLPTRADFSYTEPSDLAGIQYRRPPGPRNLPISLTQGDLYNRIYGAWLGRCAGCLLGIPVEGWPRQRILDFNRATGNYPLKTFMSSDHPPEVIEKFNLKNGPNFYGGLIPWLNNIECAPMDDDTNYTIINLIVIETCGSNLTSDDIGLIWLNNLPLLQVCTAERIAYRNLANLILPPASATYRNVFREWIGAQIRADCFGYINPGRMERAAAMAWRDACISHVKNGIYGEMWVAAMLSGAFITNDIHEIIHLGLSEIPANSRLNSAIMQILSWESEALRWEQVIDCIHQGWDESNHHHWAHTISNAMIVTTALLYGQGDLEKTITIAVSAGFDTDCNAATAGSLVGLLRGADALHSESPLWLTPLNNHLRSSVTGHQKIAISTLAQRTADLVTFGEKPP
jgi:hypothetical protein